MNEYKQALVRAAGQTLAGAARIVNRIEAEGDHVEADKAYTRFISMCGAYDALEFYVDWEGGHGEPYKRIQVEDAWFDVPEA